MNNYQIYVITFIVTALWDIILRNMSENYDNLPTFFQMDFIKYLQGYFNKHTLLSAAMVAGFVGASSQVLILYFHKIPNNSNTLLTFMLLTFIVSALYGFFIKESKLFPHLVNNYYDKLGVQRSMYLDGVSGLITQVSVLSLIFFN